MMADVDPIRCDLFVIGGGINGTGIARDAAGRGLKTVLVEQTDFAAGTSSASSKLIHGGLRYLEHYEFRLVRESLKERETLWRMAPHLVRPLRFILPHHRGLRPAFILRLGLFLYDHLGGRKLLRKTKSLNLRKDPKGTPLKSRFKKGFEYSDCWVDDARLVIANALAAKRRGATLLNGHRFLDAVREDRDWRIRVEAPGGKVIEFQADALVNAAGPWVEKTLRDCIMSEDAHSHARLVKGSHIVVPAFYDGPRCYTFQNPDKRVIFAIPYEEKYTLLGTTDVPFSGDPAKVEASEAEINYLCAAASEYFEKSVQPEDVIWSYAGIRPLYDDGEVNPSATTRDYHLDLDTREDTLPLLSVFGGKITTYRCLAEEAMEKLSPFLTFSLDDWTGYTPLPGGSLPEDVTPAKALKHFKAEMRTRFSWLEGETVDRMCNAYGSRIRTVLEGTESLDGMGTHFGAGLYEAEVRYLMREEWARTAEDILWRRSKLGLRLSKNEQAALAAWMSANTD
ncbi:glycerol-3-phosphate dehydrogenase [Kordiimonas lipolytica]|uniref:Glycerol-3-phosphate dehydrogenase n=1 Tax=Kordiimonas lipolytica TaxID=1662421 RepID=A0ABV8UFH9_9PROT|nr:glycerol-3-phosphate dehydrogenase [Kordiimonas lipolytica]